MADIPFETTLDHSEDLIMSENGHTSLIPAHLINAATHIVVTDDSVDDLGQLPLPFGQSSIETILLEGPDLFILQHDGAILVIDDFLVALEAGLLTGVSLSDGTSMDAIKFLDEFGGGDAIDNIMFSLEAAAMDNGTVDGLPVLQDASEDMINFADFQMSDGAVGDITSVARVGEADHPADSDLSATLSSLTLPRSDTLSVSALLEPESTGALESALPRNSDNSGHSGTSLLGQDAIHASHSEGAYAFGSSPVIDLPDPVTEDVSLL